MNKVIYSAIIALSLVTGALAQGQGQTSNVNVFVLVSPTTYQLDLKAIEGEIPTRNFVIKPQSVVQVKQADNLGVATQPITQIIESVKVQDQKGVIKELESLGNNVYSLAGIPVGAYILDVIADIGNQRGAYETILVILEKDQPPVQPAQIIKQIQPRADVIIFDEDNCRKGFVLIDGDCVPIPIVCKEGFKLDPNSQKCVPWPPCKQGFQNDGKGKCVPLPPCTPNGPPCPICPEGVEAGWCQDEDELLDFNCSDEGMENDPRCLNGDRHPCYPDPNAQECKDFNNPQTPYCDENTPVGQVCRDEGEEVDFGKTPTPEPIEGIPDVPEEGGEDTETDRGNIDNGNDNGDNDNLEPDPQPEPDPPEDNEGSDTDTG